MMGKLDVTVKATREEFVGDFQHHTNITIGIDETTGGVTNRKLVAVVVYSRERPLGFLFDLIHVNEWNYSKVVKVIEDTVTALKINPIEFKRLMSDSGSQMLTGLEEYQKLHPESPHLKIHNCAAHKLNNILGKVFDVFK